MLNDAVRAARSPRPCGRFCPARSSRFPRTPALRRPPVPARCPSTEAMTSVCSVGLDADRHPRRRQRRHHFRHHRRRNGYRHDQLKTRRARHPRARKGVGEKACFGLLWRSRHHPQCPAATPAPLSTSAGASPRRSQLEELKGIGKGGGTFLEKVPLLPTAPLHSQDFHLCSRPPHRFSAIAKLSVSRVRLDLRVLLVLCLFTFP